MVSSRVLMSAACASLVASIWPLSVATSTACASWITRSCSAATSLDRRVASSRSWSASLSASFALWSSSSSDASLVRTGSAAGGCASPRAMATLMTSPVVVPIHTPLIVASSTLARPLVPSCAALDGATGSSPAPSIAAKS